MNDSLAPERQPINGFKYIEKAGLFARFVAFIVDLAIMAFVMMGLIVFAQNVVMANTPVVKNAKAQYFAYNIDSGLFKMNSDGKTLDPNEFSSYDGYQKMFVDYYTVFLKSDKVPEKYEQLDLFTDYAAREKDDKKLERERSMQEAMLKIKNRYGKNAILKGVNFEEGATGRDRNRQVGGHKA